MIEKVREAKRQLRKAYYTDDWEWITPCQMALGEKLNALRMTLASDLCKFAKDYDWWDFWDGCDSEEEAIRNTMIGLTDKNQAKGIIEYLETAIEESEIATEKELARNLLGRVDEYGKEIGLWTDKPTTNCVT